MATAVVIIPARYGSTRLPGKPLLPIAGRPLILHVLQRAREIPGSERIIVATDDQRIADVVAQAGGEAVLTPPELPSGSDRVGWVAKNLACDIVVNLQGDEPFVDVNAVQSAIGVLERDERWQVATLGYPLTDEKLWNDPHVVKVLTDREQSALYFSRQPIPYFRDHRFRPTDGLLQHIGVYLYRREFLLKFLSWEPVPLEQAEKLEQLRILYHGYDIYVERANFPSVGVDTPEDVKKVEQLLERKTRQL